MGQSCSCFDSQYRRPQTRDRRSNSDDDLPIGSLYVPNHELRFAKLNDVQDFMIAECDLQEAIDLSLTLEKTVNSEVSVPSTTLENKDSIVADIECVMCLDTFDESNPKVPTLCHCGLNRTNFHLSCLYEWIERDRTCPVCRQTLYFEELE